MVNEAPPYIESNIEKQCIVEKRQFFHHPSGMSITEHVIVSGNAPEGFRRFATTVIHQMQLPNSQQAQGKRGVGIDVDTIEEAFEKLPEMIQLAIKSIESEARQAMLTQGMPPLTPRPNGRM